MDKRLLQKLLILPLLLGGQCLNSVFNFAIDRMIISRTSVIFSTENVLKHSKPDRKLNVFEYIHRNNDRVDKEQKRLLITYWKPYRTVSTDILWRWIKEKFAESNLIERFSPDSCRSALTTKAFNMSLDNLDILRKACC